MLVAVDARRRRARVARELCARELVHAQRLERVPDEREFAEPDQEHRHVVLVEEEPGEHQEQDHKRRRELRRHLHGVEGRAKAHPQPDPREVLQQHHADVHQVVRKPLPERGHEIQNRAVDDAGRELKRERHEERRQEVRQRRVHARGALARHHLELLRNDLRDADGAAERLVHRLEEQNAGPVLDGDLVAPHAQVHHAEEQTEKRVHRVLDGERRDVARLFPPGAEQQQLERNPELRPRVRRAIALRACSLRRDGYGSRRGSRRAFDARRGEALVQRLDARARRRLELGRAEVHGDGVQEVIRGVEVLRHGRAQRCEVRRASRPAVPGVHQPSAGEQHELVHQRVDGGSRLVHRGHHRPPLFPREVLQRGHYVQRLERVQTRRGLVHEDELRVVQEVHADGDALALAARNAANDLVADARVGGGDQAEVGDDQLDRALLLLQGHFRSQAELRGEHERLAHGGQSEERVLLLHVRAHARHLAGRRDDPAVREHRARDLGTRAARNAERQRVEQGGLAAPARAHEREQGAALGLAADVRQDGLHLHVRRVGIRRRVDRLLRRLAGHRVRHVAPLQVDPGVGRRAHLPRLRGHVFDGQDGRRVIQRRIIQRHIVQRRQRREKCEPAVSAATSWKPEADASRPQIPATRRVAPVENRGLDRGD